MDTIVVRCFFSAIDHVFFCYRQRGASKSGPCWVLNPQMPGPEGTSTPSAAAGANLRDNVRPVPRPPRCDGPLGERGDELGCDPTGFRKNEGFHGHGRSPEWFIMEHPI